MRPRTTCKRRLRPISDKALDRLILDLVQRIEREQLRMAVLEWEARACEE